MRDRGDVKPCWSVWTSGADLRLRKDRELTPYRKQDCDEYDIVLKTKATYQMVKREGTRMALIIVRRLPVLQREHAGIISMIGSMQCKDGTKAVQDQRVSTFGQAALSSEQRQSSNEKKIVEQLEEADFFLSSTEMTVFFKDATSCERVGYKLVGSFVLEEALDVVAAGS